MRFFDCPICHLSLPKTISVPILVNYKGKVQRILICQRCKEIKEKEAKEKK